MAGTILDRLFGFDEDTSAGSSRAAVACAVSMHDPLGARFLSADARTFAAVGVHPALVACGVRARGPRAGTWPLPGEVIESQFAAIWATAPPDAMKIGALGTTDAVNVLAQVLLEENRPPVVLDPEILDKQGDRLVPDEVAAQLVAEVLPLSSVVIVNAAEAALISGLNVRSGESLRQALKAIYDLGVPWVIGHGLPDAPHAVDWAYDGRGFVEFGVDRLPVPFLTGSGAVFSAAVTAHLARGREVLDAVDEAKKLATRAIEHGVIVAGGVGPANPLAGLYRDVGLRFSSIDDLPPE